MNYIDLDEMAENIETKDDFENFLKSLEEDFIANKKDWENDNLANFLNALCAYSKGIEGYYQNMSIPFDREKPTWKLFAEILLGAKIYQ